MSDYRRPSQLSKQRPADYESCEAEIELQPWFEVARAKIVRQSRTKEHPDLVRKMKGV